jgi:hypothetical protein
MEIDYNINEKNYVYKENETITDEQRQNYLGDYIDKNESTPSTNEVVIQQINTNITTMNINN